MREAESRGVTLTELVIVMSLATLVMLGLTSFYFASQTTWLDGSTQALAQQDATLITEKLATWVESSPEFLIDNSDSLHSKIEFHDGLIELHVFMWNQADSLLEEGVTESSLTPTTNSKVTRFQLSSLGDSIVTLTLLELKSDEGRLVQNSSTFACYNRKPGP